MVMNLCSDQGACWECSGSRFSAAQALLYIDGVLCYQQALPDSRMYLNCWVLFLDLNPRQYLEGACDTPNRTFSLMNMCSFQSIKATRDMQEDPRIYTHTPRPVKSWRFMLVAQAAYSHSPSRGCRHHGLKGIRLKKLGFLRL